MNARDAEPSRRLHQVPLTTIIGVAATATAVADAATVGVDGITGKVTMQSHSLRRNQWHVPDPTVAMNVVDAETAADAIACSSRATLHHKTQRRHHHRHRHALSAPNGNPMRGKLHGHVGMGHADAKGQAA